MPRFKDRLLDAFDIFDEFEYKSSNDHVYHTLGLIQRLKEEGSSYFNRDTGQLNRWERGCDELWSFFNHLGSRRDTSQHEARTQNKEFDASQELTVTFRDFIDQFEHLEFRVHQELYSTEKITDGEQAIENTWFWLNIVFRFATYAINATYVDGKTEQHTATIAYNLRTSESSSNWTHQPMQSPRNFLKKLRAMRKKGA